MKFLKSTLFFRSSRIKIDLASSKRLTFGEKENYNNNMRMSIIPIKILVLLFFLTFNSDAALLKPGENMRPFSLPAVDGQIFRVKMDKGQLKVERIEASGNLLSVSTPEVILLDFWATWCLPCRAAMPHLEKLYQQFLAREENKGRVEFFGVALDKPGVPIIKPFLQKIKLSYPQLCGSLESSLSGLICSAQEMASEYRVQEIPVVYLINRQGKIVYGHVGFKEEYIKEMEKIIFSLLKGNQ